MRFLTEYERTNFHRRLEEQRKKMSDRGRDSNAAVRAYRKSGQVWLLTARG